jgi:hypothetical protein
MNNTRIIQEKAEFYLNYLEKLLQLAISKVSLNNELKNIHSYPHMHIQ